MWKYFHLQVSHYCILVLVLSLFMWQKYFLASNLSSSRSSHAGSLSTNKELKKIVSWHNRHLHTYLVDDIKNSHKMTVLTAVFLQLLNFSFYQTVLRTYPKEKRKEKGTSLFSISFQWRQNPWSFFAWGPVKEVNKLHIKEKQSTEQITIQVLGGQPFDFCLCVTHMWTHCG